MRARPQILKLHRHVLARLENVGKGSFEHFDLLRVILQKFTFPFRCLVRTGWDGDLRKPSE